MSIISQMDQLVLRRDLSRTRSRRCGLGSGRVNYFSTQQLFNVKGGALSLPPAVSQNWFLILPSFSKKQMCISL